MNPPIINIPPNTHQKLQYLFFAPPKSPRQRRHRHSLQPLIHIFIILCKGGVSFCFTQKDSRKPSTPETGFKGNFSQRRYVLRATSHEVVSNEKYFYSSDTYPFPQRLVILAFRPRIEWPLKLLLHISTNPAAAKYSLYFGA